MSCLHQPREPSMIARMTAGTLLALTSVVTTAQAASGAGPYYAPPAWSQKLVCTSQANCPRFVVLTDWNNEAVLDRETGLVWQRTPSDQASHRQTAAVECIVSSTGERRGWRLPSLDELTSLHDPTAQQDLKLPAGHPFINVLPNRRYWSTTRSTSFPDNTWTVAYAEALWLSSTSIGEYHHWCVRGAGFGAAH